MQRSVGKGHSWKQSLFILTKTEINPTGEMLSYLILEHEVHIITSPLQIVEFVMKT
jgi:hypothetical protein